MKLSDYKKDYYQYTSLASTTSRQLALAGIALVWVFKIQGVSGFELPNALLLPLVGLILSLFFDLLQYCLGSIIWGSFHRYHEKKRLLPGDDPSLEAPAYLTWPINLFFLLKIIAVLISYWFLLLYAVSSITFTSAT